MDMCYLACAYRTPSGYCGRTAGAATCPHRQKKKTNADRIRAMSDEALAGWLSIYCRGKTPPYEPCRNSCEACWLDWLREEAEP